MRWLAVLLLVGGCYPQILGPAVSLSTTVNTCPTPIGSSASAGTPSSASPVGKIGPQ